jgi:group I intron endonuclease
MGCIYIIKNRLNERCYVGLTTRAAHVRWLEHVKGVRECSPYPLHRAIRKYGFKAFKFSILEFHETLDDLNAAEARLIAEHIKP